MGSRYDIVMVWYQNDWGLYGRRNEMLARTLSVHPQVRKLVHIEPPIEIEQLKGKLKSNTFDDNVEVNLKRIQKHVDGNVISFTPHVPGGLIEKENRELNKKQLRELKAAENFENLILWLYPPHVLSAVVIEEFGDQAKIVVSDCVDDHRKYARNKTERIAIHKSYANMLRYSDIVFSVSDVFLHDLKPFNQNIHYLPNAAGSSNILKAQREEVAPEDMKAIPHPILGYTGALSFRIDCGLLEFVTKSRPDWNIVLIGTAPSAKLIELNARYNNLHLLGPKRYTDLNSYLNCFDVALIPHLVDATTASMNPLKLYDYLRCGKPVVTTRIAGVEDFQAVIEIADTKEGYIDAIEKCLNDDTSKKCEMRKEAVQGHTWEDRVEVMMELINKTEKKKKGTSTLAYYQYSRPEIQALVPVSSTKILDVGCANGALGRALKDRQTCEVTGVEYVPEIASQAAAVLDNVYTGEIEDYIRDLPSSYFDCIIFADVLEHLRNPEEILSAIRKTLVAGGKVIASIPNVRHWSVLKNLLEGRWDYEDAGILDRTHLRFFTKSSLVRMFTKAGFGIDALSGTKMRGWEVPDNLIASLGTVGLDTASLKEEGEIYQYLVTAVPQKSIVDQPDTVGITSIADAARLDTPDPPATNDMVQEEYNEIKQLVDKGLIPEAIRRLEALLVLNQDFALGHNNLGVLYYQNGDKKKSLTAYQRAIELEPDNATFLKNLADFICVEEGRVEEAMQIYVHLLAQSPDDVEILMTLGQVCDHLGKSDDAREFYEIALKSSLGTPGFAN